MDRQPWLAADAVLRLLIAPRSQPGRGAAIKTHNPGLIVPASVRDLLIRRAEEAGTSYQLEALEGGSTDGRAIQVARAGVPIGVISIPLRYVHTTSETADMRDVRAAVDLLVAVLCGEIALMRYDDQFG
jgi:putative aminopeptidase FrvX